MDILSETAKANKDSSGCRGLGQQPAQGFMQRLLQAQLHPGALTSCLWSAFACTGFPRAGSVRTEVSTTASAPPSQFSNPSGKGSQMFPESLKLGPDGLRFSHVPGPEPSSVNSAEDLGNWRNKCFFEGRLLSLLRLLEFIFKNLCLIGLLHKSCLVGF